VRLRSVSRLRVRRILAFFFMVMALFPLHPRGTDLSRREPSEVWLPGDA
jgi:hypothetical protein